MEHTPPPRFGDWSAVNRHLTAGGTVEGIRQENPYREYYLSLIKKHMEEKIAYDTQNPGNPHWVYKEWASMRHDPDEPTLEERQKDEPEPTV